ncbi:hypothetical protein V5O48_011460, partial [Marasmius crinis-equi]
FRIRYTDESSNINLENPTLSGCKLLRIVANVEIPSWFAQLAPYGRLEAYEDPGGIALFHFYKKTEAFKISDWGNADI